MIDVRSVFDDKPRYEYGEGEGEDEEGEASQPEMNDE